MIELDSLRARAGETGYWYLATPYSKYPRGIEAAFDDACAVAGWLIRNRVPVFCPIAHSHAIAVLGDVDPLNHEIWLPADAPFMHAAIGLIVCMMPGWQESYGVKFEMDAFQSAGKEIEFLPYPIHL